MNGFSVWEVPPLKEGIRLTTSSTTTKEEKEVTERFYVKGSKIRNKITNEFYTVDEICQILNHYVKDIDKYSKANGKLMDKAILAESENKELKKLLTECESEFRKYDGRKLFDLEYVVYAEILNKISEVLDPK